MDRRSDTLVPYFGAEPALKLLVILALTIVLVNCCTNVIVGLCHCSLWDLQFKFLRLIRIIMSNLCSARPVNGFNRHGTFCIPIPNEVTSVLVQPAQGNHLHFTNFLDTHNMFVKSPGRNSWSLES